MQKISIYKVYALALLTLFVSAGVWLTNVGAHTLLRLPPQILSLGPSEGYNDLPSEVTICGEGFTANTTASIEVLTDTLPLANQALYGEGCLVGTVPAGLPAGEHTILVATGDGEDSASYRILDETLNDDLWALGGQLWEQPAYGAREDEEIEIGLMIYRRGGRERLQNVTVRFYENHPDDAAAVPIGDGIIPLLPARVEPNERLNGVSTPAVAWTPSQGAGAYAIYAVLDPDNAVSEDIESNNIVSRTIEVLPSDPLVDLEAPTVEQLMINEADGGTIVSEPEVTLTVASSDIAQEGVEPRGVSNMQVVEYRFNEAAFTWLPVYAKPWQPFATLSSWALHPTAGLHFLQAWSSDGAGNISAVGKQKAVNYAPTCAPLAEGGTHFYRQHVEAGQTLRVEVAPCSGDADLYIWPPDWNGEEPWLSYQLETLTETLLITDTVSGEYQIEVHGYSATEYNIVTEVSSDTIRAHLASQKREDKPIPSTPKLPLGSVPNVDNMFNISPAPVMPLPTPIPCTSLARGTTEIYHQYVTQGEQIEVEVAPCQGDANLYLWSPDLSELWQKHQTGEASEVLPLTAPFSGEYQIEVYGQTAGEYRMSITTSPMTDSHELDDACAQATPILSDGTLQKHTFHTSADLDWVKFEAISGTIYLIEATPSSRAQAEIGLNLYDACSDVQPIARQSYAFTPDIRLPITAEQSGELYLRVSSDGSSSNIPYEVAVRALPETSDLGAVVIVAGHWRENDPLEDNIHNVTNDLYRFFHERGYPAERIHYLASDISLDANHDGQADVDHLATQQRLEQVITIEAAAQVDSQRPLTLYLIGHGEDDLFYLNGTLSETISPNDLHGWLDVLAESAPDVEVTLIVDAADSGHFISSGRYLSTNSNIKNVTSLPLSQDEAHQQVSGSRLIITSSNTDTVTYPSPSGTLFSDAFLQALKGGQSLMSAFEEATWALEVVHPEQTPWLDGNADGLPNQAEDQQLAQQKTAAPPLMAPQWAPYVVSAKVRHIEGLTSTIEAEVRDDAGIIAVWGIIEAADLHGEEATSSPLLLQDPESDGIYSTNVAHFQPGSTYRILLYAVDNDGLQARPYDLKIQPVKEQSNWQLYLPTISR